MPRTVDPQRHALRRQAIVDAAFTCFAREGYDGATTASICREAAIGSGTFFHYFPSKVSVLLAILSAGTDDTLTWFASQQGRDDPRLVVLDWAQHTADAAADPRLPGFVRAVGAVAAHPEVAAALVADEQAQRRGLRPWVRRAQVGRAVRTDLSAAAVTSWVILVLDGYLGRLAADAGFSARTQQVVLLDTISRFLAPASA